MLNDRSRKRLDILIVVIAGILTAVSIFYVTRLNIDSSIKVFIPEKNETKLMDERHSAEFGSADTLLLGIKTRFNKITAPENLNIVSEITKELEEIPAVEEVISLTNMDYIEPSAEGMSVMPLVDEASNIDSALFRKRLEDWHEMYYGTILSEDESLTAILIQPKKDSTEAEKTGIYQSMEKIAAAYKDSNLTFALAGRPVIQKEISRSVQRDIIYLIPIAAALIILVLGLSFRRFEGVLFPLVCLAASCLWVMGLMGALQLTFTMATILVPVLLLVVGSAYGIHFMTHFYEGLNEAKDFIDYPALRKLLSVKLKTIFLSILLAGATTAAGFIAQLSSPLGPFRVFGVMSGVGIGFSLILTFILLPALIRLRYPNGIDPKRAGFTPEKKKQGGNSSSAKLFKSMVFIVKKRKIPVLMLAVIILGFCIFLVPRITVGTNLIEFFTKDTKLVRDTNTYNNEMNGTGSINLVIEAPDTVLQPAFLLQLEEFEQWLPKQLPHVTKVNSIIPVFKRMNRIMNWDSVPYESAAAEEPEFDFFAGDDFGDFFTDEEDSAGQDFDTYIPGNLSEPENKTNPEGMAFDEIPSDPAKYGLETGEDLNNLLSQYLILYSGSLDMMLNDSLEPTRILTTIQMNGESSRQVREARREIEAYWDYYIEDGWSYELSGPSIFNVVLADLVVRSQLISLSLSLLIVWIILIVLFRSIKLGTIGMIPVFFALAGIFTFMVLLGFNLDIVTSLLASLAVGIGVDYAIHFMSAYRRTTVGDKEQRLEKVYSTTGKAILYNASSVALGFLGLFFSRFIPIRQMGILFAVSMAFAALSSLIILPIVLDLMRDPFKQEKRNNDKKESEEWQENVSTA